MNVAEWESNMSAIVLAAVDQQVIQIKVGEQPLSVEVAASQMTRMAGLGDRDELPHDGMLFMYAEDVSRGYHRSTMRFPIAIRFYDAAGQLVHEDLSSPAVYPPQPYRYVLETAMNRLLAGDLSIDSIS